METKYSRSNLLTFTAVADMDLATINFMIDKYKKSVYFNQYVVNASSENVKRNLLLARTSRNPITVLLQEQYTDSADDMLKEIYEKHLEEVFKFLEPTDILKFVKTLEMTDGVFHCNIICENELQKQYIKNLDDSLSVEVSLDRDMKLYDCLFVKHVEEPIMFKNLGGKYIFISNYMFNIDQETGELKKVILPVAGHNKVRTIDPFIGLTIPKITMEVNE